MYSVSCGIQGCFQTFPRIWFQTVGAFHCATGSSLGGILLTIFNEIGRIYQWMLLGLKMDGSHKEDGPRLGFQVPNHGPQVDHMRHLKHRDTPTKLLESFTQLL